MRTPRSWAIALRRRWTSLWLTGLATLLIVSSLTLPQTPLAGAAGDTGYRDFSFGFTQAPFGNPDNGPTGEKPQSKLWFNDGSWWDVLYNPTAGAGGEYHIYQLDKATQTWSDRGVVVDTRRYSHADALWDGSHLYIATALQPGMSDADKSARVLRFSYNASTQSYSLDAGFPVVVASVPMEAIVMDKDTTGMLWVTYTYGNGQGGRSVYVSHTGGSDATWVTPFVLPATGATTLTADDLSAVVAYNGKIGVMWSNQTASTMYFASHTDGAADNVWQQNPALQGPSYADDHINLKSLQADASGQVFAAVKTSLQDVPNQNPSAPQILLLVLNQKGSWSRRTFGTVGDDHSRPIVVIDNSARELYVFATTNNGNPPSGIYYKKTSLDKINFPTGLGTPFMESSNDTNINNATSKKGSVDGTTGLVVLASDVTTGNYWHNTLGMPAPVPTATPSGPTATPTPTNTPLATPTATAVSSANLAVGRPATASSLESASYPASNAVDGNGGTRWSSQFSDPQWLAVDLGQSYAIDRVRLSWETAYGSAYQIQVSSDNATWTTIYSATTGTGGVNDLTVSGTGRYVRMYGTQRGTPWGYSLWEFQVYGSAATTQAAALVATLTIAPTATSAPAAPTATPTATSVPATPTAVPTSVVSPTPTPKKGKP